MARCQSCSAPLEPNTNRCLYCGVRNDVDLQNKYTYTVQDDESDKICPNCDSHLQTIDLKLNQHFCIQRCPQCFGLFFEPGEIEVLLDSAVSDALTINLKHIQNIDDERYQHKEVKYLKCPVCRVLMNRVNFGYRSGVVANRCKTHGIWLDNGEITHLMEWKKAGGQLLDEQKASHHNTARPIQNHPTTPEFEANNPFYPRFTEETDDSHLLNSISSVLLHLFEKT